MMASEVMGNFILLAMTEVKHSFLYTVAEGEIKHLGSRSANSNKSQEITWMS